MVELMILFHRRSPISYYAGMIITFMFVLGFLPLSIAIAMLLAVIIFVIYLFPILLFDTITNRRVFISNIAFLTATVVIGLFWRHISSVAPSELNFPSNTTFLRKKKQLQEYSTQLEADSR